MTDVKLVGWSGMLVDELRSISYTRHPPTEARELGPMTIFQVGIFFSGFCPGSEFWRLCILDCCFESRVSVGLDGGSVGLASVVVCIAS